MARVDIMGGKHDRNNEVNRSRRQALRTLGMAGTVGVAGLAGTGTALGDQLNALTGAGQIQPQQANQLYREVLKLTASDAQAGDEFGYSVAVSGDGTTALVGLFAKTPLQERHTSTTWVEVGLPRRNLPPAMPEHTMSSGGQWR